MTRTKKIAKTLTSLQERSVKTKMSKDDEHMTINIMSRGKDGKKGTDDDKSVRTNKIKVRGDASPHPVTHKYTAEDKKWHWYNLERGVYRMAKDYHGKVIHNRPMFDRKTEVKQGYPNAFEVKSTVKQAAKYVEKKNGLNEASEWEEVYGDTTYQDSHWGDPATIRGKIEIARNKVAAKKKEEDEEQDHKIHQQRTNESNKKSYDQFIKEARGSTAVFTFGRFNPPTIGHEKLLNVVASTASKVRGDQYVFSSHSQDAKKNPLTNDQKVVFMKMMFPKHRRSIMKTDVRTAFEAVSELHDMKKYSKIVMVVGSDRVKEFNTVLNKYNDVEGRHGYYRFDDIDVISAGERDPDSDGVSGMSASKMRAAVAEDDYDSFKMGVPPTVSEKDCHTLYKAVSKGMRIKEERIREEWELDELEEAPKPAKSKPPSKGLSPSQRRRMALRMKIQAKKPSFIMKRLRSMKRAATKAKLYMRARKAAVQKVVAKFYPKLKTKKRSELSYAERGKISDIVKKKKSVIARFAKRMVKDKRKQDVERRKSMNKPKDK